MLMKTEEKTVALERTDLKGFDRGERIIMVDGVRWGRTRVSYHGCHGTKHTFEQDGGGTIEERPGEIYPGKVSVRSENKRWRDKATWRPTEERVLEKARELVAADRLRHPNVVKAENKKAMDAYRAHSAGVEVARKAEFQSRARQALGINDDEPSELVDRVVAAMEWAQTR